MPISPLPPAVLQYIASFHLAAVCKTRDGRLGVCRNPQGAEAAWWCRDDHAGDIVKLARRNGGDVVGAASELGLPLTVHDRVVARVVTAIGAITGETSLARQSGGLKFFNAEFKRRRIEAAASGRPFMTYDAAERRLHRALSDVAAERLRGEVTGGDLISRVFG